jgi:hypothetical protein
MKLELRLVDDAGVLVTAAAIELPNDERIGREVFLVLEGHLAWIKTCLEIADASRREPMEPM